MYIPYPGLSSSPPSQRHSNIQSGSLDTQGRISFNHSPHGFRVAEVMVDRGDLCAIIRVGRE